MRTIIINRGEALYGTMDGVAMLNVDLWKVVRKALKEGTASKLVDTDDTIMYRVDVKEVLRREIDGVEVVVLDTAKGRKLFLDGMLASPDANIDDDTLILLATDDFTVEKRRKLWAIANDILADWKKPYFGAVPYIHAMKGMETMEDYYGMDSARSIVNYFLANASTWRGEKAKEIKTELKRLLK